MADACESLINDYVSGTLTIADLEQGLSDVFDAAPASHSDAQSHLQGLYSNEKIDATHFTEISNLISRVNIQSTINNSSETDSSYFGEDQTLVLTDMDEEDDDGSSDKTVIIKIDPTDLQATSITKPSRW